MNLFRPTTHRPTTRRPSAPRPASRSLASLLLAVVAAPAFAAVPAGAQSASVGADVVSRYVWRGTDFGESLSVQPALTFGFGNLEVGAWGSYSVSASGADSNENDLWATYTINASNGASIAFTVTDYYFPTPGAEEGFSYTASHTLELAVGFTGPESFPISLYGGLVASNDPHNPVYLEASLPVSAFADIDVGLVAGMVTGESNFYGTDGAAVVNLGVSASKALEVTDSFAPPVSVSYIFNPDTDRAFLVFGISFAP